MGKALSTFLLLCSTSIGWPATARADFIVFSEGSVDLALSLDPPRKWDLVASADAGKFDLQRVQIQLGPNTMLTQPADPRFAFTGASPGNPIWILPQQTIDAVGKVFLSINNEGVVPGSIASYTESDPRVASAGSREWVKISLLSVTGSGPDHGGQFSLWQTGVFGNPLLWMSTFANPNPNTLFELAGTELHFNWGFTAPGEYDVTVQASAFLPDGRPTVSHPPFTIAFVVEPDGKGSPGAGPAVAAPVPEPSGLGLLSLGGGLILMAVGWRRCRCGLQPAEAAG
jgi:surface-anchored protein